MNREIIFRPISIEPLHDEGGGNSVDRQPIQKSSKCIQSFTCKSSAAGPGYFRHTSQKALLLPFYFVLQSPKKRESH